VAEIDKEKSRLQTIFPTEILKFLRMTEDRNETQRRLNGSHTGD
jgi:hypothetical protein